MPYKTLKGPLKALYLYFARTPSEHNWTRNLAVKVLLDGSQVRARGGPQGPGDFKMAGGHTPIFLHLVVLAFWLFLGLYLI